MEHWTWPETFALLIRRPRTLVELWHAVNDYPKPASERETQERVHAVVDKYKRVAHGSG